MAEPSNALAPQVTGVNRLIDWVAQKLDPKWFPTAGRTLLETAQGKKDPISESHFSPEELEVMRQLIALKGGDKGSINYGDYIKTGMQMREGGKLPMSVTPGLFSLGDPLGNIQTTLGRFRYARDVNGNMQIVDTYDFNPPVVGGTTQEARTGEYGALGPYALIREYAGEKIPTGYGRKVNINLGK